ncbi:hypothetical protein FBU30_003237, partial [Linnemannia zychae]
MVNGWPYVSERFDSQEKIDSVFRNINIQEGIRSLGIDPGIASTATATLIHSKYEKDSINLDIPRGPRDDIDRRYRKQQSHLKIEAGITEIESRLVQRKSVEISLAVDAESQIIDNNTVALSRAVRAATHDYEANLEDHLANVAKESSVLRSYYGSTKFKQDKFDYREALRHDLDKATTAVLRMRNHVPSRQPTADDLEKILFQLDEDIKTSMEVVNGLPNVKAYNWAPFVQLMDEVKNHSGIEREVLLKSKSFVR